MSQSESRPFAPSPGIKIAGNPLHEAKLSGEKGERDCQLAMQVLQVARDMRVGKDVTAEALKDYAEVLWQWVVSE
jgi:hypothetical protein